MIFPQFTTSTSSTANPKTNPNHTDLLNNFYYPQLNGFNQTSSNSALNHNTSNSCTNGLLIPDILQQTLLTNQSGLFDSNLMSHNFIPNFTLTSNQSPFYPHLNNQLGGIKRTIPDFQTNTILGSTISLESDQNDTKKSKIEVLTNTDPSKVLHIRNIATRAQESDITLLAVPFGKIRTMVFAKKTNQALLELQDASEATRMFDFYNEYPPRLNGRSMIVQYSRHRSLELKLQNPGVDNSIMLANRMVDEHRTKYKDVADCKGANNNGERRILRIVIENYRDIPINHLIMFKIFQRFGKVLRIIIFNKNMQCQCLVEMDNNISAHVALLHLNGQDLYPDCCKLRVEFSRHPTDSLQIQRQNDKCRDYVLSPIGEEEQVFLDMMDSPNNFMSPYHTSVSANSVPSTTVISPHQNGFNQIAFDAASLGLQPSFDQLVQKQNLLTSNPQDIMSAVYNNMLFPYFPSQLNTNALHATTSPLPTTPPTLLMPVSMATQATHTPTTAIPTSNQTPNYFNTNNHNTLDPHLLQQHCAIQNGIASQLYSDTSVPIVIEDINEEKITHEQLYNLLSLYGTVTKIAILPKGSRSAIVHMKTYDEAQQTVQMLNKCEIYGFHLSLYLIQNGYMNPLLNIGNNPGVNYRNYPYNNLNVASPRTCLTQPTNCLRFLNLPATYQKQDIVRLLEGIGQRKHCTDIALVNDNLTINSNMKSAIVHMENIESSLVTIMMLNNKSIISNSTNMKTEPSSAPGQLSTTALPGQTIIKIEFIKN